MFFKWKRLGRSGKGTTILNSLQELDPRNPDARIQRVLSSEPAAYARYCVFSAALPICKCSRRLAWTVAHLDSLSERMTKRFESQVRLELEWHKVHAMQWQGMVSNLCRFHISICNLRSIRMDGSKNTRSWIFWIPPTIRSFVIGKSRPVHELVLLIDLSQDGEDTSKDWICLRSKANGEPYLDLVTGWDMGTVQAPDAYTWLRHGTWKNPIARTMLRIENIPNIWVRIRHCCFGWPAMVIPRTFCSSIVASVKTCCSQECFLLDWCKSWAFCTQVRWTQLPTQREVLPMQWTASKQRTLGALPVKFAEAD